MARAILNALVVGWVEHDRYFCLRYADQGQPSSARNRRCERREDDEHGECPKHGRRCRRPDRYDSQRSHNCGQGDPHSESAPFHTGVISHASGTSASERRQMEVRRNRWQRAARPESICSRPTIANFV